MRMLQYLEDSDITKVSTREVEDQTNQGSMLCASRGKLDMRKEKCVSNFQAWRKRGPHRKKGEMGSTMEGLGRAGEALPNFHGESGVFKRKTRSSGRSGGEQTGHAEDSTRRLSETNF